MTTQTLWAEAGPAPKAGAKAHDLLKPGPSLFVKRAKPLETVEDVRQALQLAIELEHATLPAYLQAAYSLDDAKNGLIASMIQTIVMQEMEHFCRAANILVAIGGKPAIADPRFVPTYPGGLPKHIGTQPGQPDFIVNLRKFSKEQVRDAFMIIEEPEYPIEIHEAGKRLRAAALQENYRTIGDFYGDIAQALTDLGDGVFSHTEKGQVTGVLGVKAILGLDDALAAIALIIREGEGDSTSPEEGPSGDMAHYYTFYEIFKGRKIVLKDGAWCFGDEEIPFDPSGVQNIVENPRQEDYPPGTAAAVQSAAFNTYYSNLLKALDQSFNGDPDKINNAIGLMFDLKIQAKLLMATPVPGGAGKFAAPCWQYVG